MIFFRKKIKKLMKKSFRKFTILQIKQKIITFNKNS